MFDPFSWACRFLPARTLEKLINLGMAAVCLLFLVRRSAQYRYFTLKPLWAVETLVFLVLVLAYLFRREAVDRSRGLTQIGVPLAASILPFALLWSDPTPLVVSSRTLTMAVFWAMTAATSLTLWGMWALRRSFSITVEARELVTGGPYRFLRHPVYAGEILTTAVVALWRFSPVNAAVLAAFVALQLYRARMEEIKLAGVLPAYAAYARRTWWLWSPPGSAREEPTNDGAKDP